MTRPAFRTLAPVFFLMMCLSPFVSTHAADNKTERPNFVVILCDDLGYGDLGCFGHPHIKTPNLDRLASQGIRLTDCYSSAPVCSSSRVGLLTGRTPNRTGVYDWIPNGHPVHLKKEEVTIAKLLRDAGYTTAHSGKWHCNGKFNSKEQPQPGDHGFDHWFSTQNNASPSHANPKNFVRNGKEVGPLEGYSCQLVAKEAIDWLNHRDKGKPFYLHVCFHEPHEPVASPHDVVGKYSGIAESEDQAQYFANVTNMDLAVGDIMEKLDSMGLSQSTLVFFTSDNGPETLNRYRSANRSYGSPGPLRGMKLHIYDGGIRVPGILRWTGKVKPGQTSAVPVCGLDVLPTFCELAGIEAPKDRAIDGSSFVALLKREEMNRRQPLFWHYYRAISPPRVAMRDGDWKIVAHWNATTELRELGSNVNPNVVKFIKTAQLSKFELYNLKDDIGEKDDLANQHPDVLNKMKAAVIKKYTEVQQESPQWPELEAYYKKLNDQRKKNVKKK